MADIRVVSGNGQPCPYCARTMVLGDLKLQPTNDHVKPRSRFGPKGRRNGETIIVCSECNFMKNNLTLEEFLQYLALKNDLLGRAIACNVERINQIRYLLAIGLE